MRISDWSSDVCSSDLAKQGRWGAGFGGIVVEKQKLFAVLRPIGELTEDKETPVRQANHGLRAAGHGPFLHGFRFMARFNASKSGRITRSEEHTSELQSLMRISYAVFCLKKKKNSITNLIN